MNKLVSMIHVASVSRWIMTLATHRGSAPAIRVSLFMPVLFPSHGHAASPCSTVPLVVACIRFAQATPFQFEHKKLRFFASSPSQLPIVASSSVPYCAFKPHSPCKLFPAMPVTARHRTSSQAGSEVCKYILLRRGLSRSFRGNGHRTSDSDLHSGPKLKI
jgi:hypothetical protein